MHFPAHIIGLMSGTSADGVDAALLFTDGREVVQPGESLFVPYSTELRAEILALMRGVGDSGKVARALTQMHIDAVQKLQEKFNIKADLVGFHGQTIRHAPELGITEQIGDAQWLADATGIPVVADFRSNDVKHGGQGAPLVPLYHAALARDLPKPLMVVNIGGVANVTFVGGDEDSASRSAAAARAACGQGEAQRGGLRSPMENLLAFDCGPGNALLDDWVYQHSGARYDKDGAIAARGTVDGHAVAAFLNHEFFARPAPKSLDRNQFALALVQHLSAEDGAATLTAMTVAAMVKALELVPEMPKQMLVTGGGRHNPTMMGMLQSYFNSPLEGESTHCFHASVGGNGGEDIPPRDSKWNPRSPSGGELRVLPVEAVGWDGDMLEAQAFAYLAARSMQGLPLSLPSTTGVKEAVSGGVLFEPKK